MPNAFQNDVSSEPVPLRECAHSRRVSLTRRGGGFGSLALWSMLGRDLQARPIDSGANRVSNPLSAKSPQLAAKAKSVIWCFLDGGPSHLDLFDPKPTLNKLAGKPLPGSFARPMTAMGKTAFTPLMASPRRFAKYGQSGTWVSDLYPEIATCVDDMAVIRSCWADGITHVAGVCQLNTGSILPGRPSLGSWAIHGLGTECADLPSFVVLADSTNDPPGGSGNW